MKFLGVIFFLLILTSCATTSAPETSFWDRINPFSTNAAMDAGNAGFLHQMHHSPAP